MVLYANWLSESNALLQPHDSPRCAQLLASFAYASSAFSTHSGGAHPPQNRAFKQELCAMLQSRTKFPQYFSHLQLRTIDARTCAHQTRRMARYSAFLGRAVNVLYRAGDLCLPASGTFVADSGRSIFLEQHFEQCGQLKNFRWEIPYPCIVRLEEAEPLAAPQAAPSAKVLGSKARASEPLQANAAHASG